MRRLAVLLSAFLLLCAASGCSLRKRAVSTLGSALADSSSVYATENDPELVAEALPFALKTMEALILEQPENRELLLAAGKGFAGYSWGFVQLEAERIEPEDYRRSEELRRRALDLYLRARNYSLRALAVAEPGIREALRRRPEEAAQELGRDSVEEIYWTAASWGAAISLGKDRPELLADLGAVMALFERALELEPTWGEGMVHEAMISLKALPPTLGGDLESAKAHFERAVELSGGRRAGPYVTYAEKIAVQTQDRSAYVDMLSRALEIDPDAVPAQRLNNILVQEKARWLLDRTDDYFIGDPEAGDPERQRSGEESP